MSIEAKEEFRPKIVAFCCNWCSLPCESYVYPAGI